MNWNLFKKDKPWDKPFSPKVAKRVEKIATADLSNWSEQVLSEINRCLRSYESSREDYYLKEALIGAEALHALIAELNKRSML